MTSMDQWREITPERATLYNNDRFEVEDDNILDILGRTSGGFDAAKVYKRDFKPGSCFGNASILCTEFQSCDPNINCDGVVDILDEMSTSDEDEQDRTRTFPPLFPRDSEANPSSFESQHRQRIWSNPWPSAQPSEDKRASCSLTTSTASGAARPHSSTAPSNSSAHQGDRQGRAGLGGSNGLTRTNKKDAHTSGGKFGSLVGHALIRETRGQN
jgi:hypothetical protein